MAKYAKDTGKYLRPLNFSGTFGRVDKVALDLINSCKYLYRDKRGEYTYTAVAHDQEGNVTFRKTYRNPEVQKDYEFYTKYNY
jgi:hypothetical protein